MPGLYLLCALVMREYTAGAYKPNAGSSRSRLHTNQTDMRPSSNLSPSPGQTSRALSRRLSCEVIMRQTDILLLRRRLEERVEWGESYRRRHSACGGGGWRQTESGGVKLLQEPALQ